MPIIERVGAFCKHRKVNLPSPHILALSYEGCPPTAMWRRIVHIIYMLAHRIATSLNHIGGCPLTVRHGDIHTASYDDVSQINHHPLTTWA